MQRATGNDGVLSISGFLFPKCHPMSQRDTYSTWRRHVRCRSHDLSSLPHHLLVSTYVSPVGAITIVRRPDAADWLQKTKRHPSSLVCCSVTVVLMSRSWRDWSLVSSPCSQKHKETEPVNYLLKHAGWSRWCWNNTPAFLSTLSARIYSLLWRKRVAQFL